MNVKPYSKFITAIGAAVAVAVAVAADGIIEATDLIQIALAFLGAIGVYVVPNRST